ncbi:MAG: hypothetical protein ACE5OP_09910 [Candidatus Glassbacteria bacterium]
MAVDSGIHRLYYRADMSVSVSDDVKKSLRIGTGGYLLVLLAISISAILFLVHEPDGGGFPLDDSWIHLVFARNIVTSHDFSFEGDSCGGGMTAPLWTLIVSVIYKICGTETNTTLWGMKATGLAFLFVTAVGLIRLTLIVGASRYWAVFAGILSCLVPRLMWGALSGMEVTLSSAAFTWTMVFSFKETKWSSIVTGFLCGASVAVRPELLLVLPLVIISRIATRKSADSIGLSPLLAGYFAAMIPYIMFNLYCSGSILPSTFYALSDPVTAIGARIFTAPFTGLSRLLLFLLRDNFLLPLMAIAGAYSVYIGRANRRLGITLILVLVSIPISKDAITPHIPIGYHWGRHVAYLSVAAICLASVGLSTMEDAFSRSGKATSRVTVFLVALSALFLLITGSRSYGENIYEVESVNVRVGKWLKLNTPEEAIVATHDIGAIAFFSERKILDTVGIVNAQARDLSREYGEGEGFVVFLERERPHYLAIFPVWYPNLYTGKLPLVEVYRVKIPRRTILADDEMVVYRIEWSPKEPPATLPSG